MFVMIFIEKIFSERIDCPFDYLFKLVIHKASKGFFAFLPFKQKCNELQSKKPGILFLDLDLELWHGGKCG